MTRNVATHGMRADWNAHQRGAWVILALWQGSRLSNRDVARLTGMTRRGANYMMETLSALFPLVVEDGKWVWMAKNE